MKRERVEPLNSFKENIYVCMSVVVIILVSLILLKIVRNNDVEKHFGKDEISLLYGISNLESSIYSDIKNALIEISFFESENNEYPTVNQLEEDMVDPFYKNEIWEERGSIIWSMYNLHGKTHYLGVSQNLSKVGNFDIEINDNDIENSYVYYTKENIENIYEKRRFHDLESIMKKIVAHTGEDERGKITGGRK